VKGKTRSTSSGVDSRVGRISSYFALHIISIRKIKEVEGICLEATMTDWELFGLFFLTNDLFRSSTSRGERIHPTRKGKDGEKKKKKKKEKEKEKREMQTLEAVLLEFLNEFRPEMLWDLQVCELLPERIHPTRKGKERKGKERKRKEGRSESSPSSFLTNHMQYGQCQCQCQCQCRDS
jgi:hypothetical protein